MPFVTLKDKENIWYAVIYLNKYNQLLPYFKIFITLCRMIELFKTSQNNRVHRNSYTQVQLA